MYFHTQRWINILGHVSPGSDILRLTYALNGGKHQALTFHEDFHRLARNGDFNVEIERTRLQSGENQVVLRAVTEGGHTAEHAMTFDYLDDDRKWPLPYEVDWSQVHRIQDVVQVIDGKWTLSPQGIRSVEPYYDRVIALGDGSWRDYEVRTTVTLHPVRLCCSRIMRMPPSGTSALCHWISGGPRSHGWGSGMRFSVKGTSRCWGLTPIR